jgi:hypothetical protein
VVPPASTGQMSVGRKGVSPRRLSVSTAPLHLFLLILVCGAVAIGTYSRLVGITEIGMWTDEFHSLRLSDPSQSISQLFQARVANEGPPLYQLWLFAFRKLAAESEVQMRLVQNLLFAAGVLLLWTRLNPVPGLLVRSIQSAFLLGSYGLIYYSSELRSYSLVIALAIPQSLLLLRVAFALEKGPGIPHGWLTIFALVSVALSLVHYVAAVAVGASFALLAVIVLAAGRRRALLAIVSYGVATCLPVVGWFLASYDSTSVALVHLLGDPVFLVRQIDRFLRLLGGSIAAALCLSILIAATAWTAARALASQGMQAPVEIKAALWLGTLAAATWVIACAFTLAVVPILTMRNLLVTAPAIYLALGFVLGFWLNSNAKVAQAGVAMAILYLMLSTASNLFDFDSDLLNHQQKKDWVASAERLNALDDCTAQPILVVAERVGFYRHYLDGSKNIELVPIGTPNWTALAGTGRIEERVELSAGEVARARELTRSSRCGVKMWHVPIGFVSEEQALDLGARILGAGNFRLDRIGNAILYRG